MVSAINVLHAYLKKFTISLVNQNGNQMCSFQTASECITMYTTHKWNWYTCKSQDFFCFKSLVSYRVFSYSKFGLTLGNLLFHYNQFNDHWNQWKSKMSWRLTKMPKYLLMKFLSSADKSYNVYWPLVSTVYEQILTYVLAVYVLTFTTHTKSKYMNVIIFCMRARFHDIGIMVLKNEMI